MKEHPLAYGGIFAITWTDDSQRICAGGEGKDIFAKAVIASSGSKCGELPGPSKKITSLSMKPKPYRLAMSGENYEIYIYEGVPFKYLKVLSVHNNFINKVAFNPSGSILASVSSDKTIVFHNSETWEVVQKIEKAHTKGIIDCEWVDNDTLITCSSDNHVKVWNAKEGTELK
jgi:WD40 repeat protein